MIWSILSFLQEPSLITNLASPRSLPSPPPSRISTQGQPTSEELVGSNYRRSGSPIELALTPPSKQPRIPHVLGKVTLLFMDVQIFINIFGQFLSVCGVDSVKTY